MPRNMHAALTLGLLLVAIPLRAANRSHAGTDSRNRMVWTNADLDRLHDLDLISIVGQTDDEGKPSEPSSEPYRRTQDPSWYAAEAAKLRGELEYRQTQLREYRQALDDARSLSDSTGGVDLVGDDFAITPDAGIEILQQRVNEVQADLDALADLARRNDIEPGTLRGE
jgi:hypothetical protein